MKCNMVQLRHDLKRGAYYTYDTWKCSVQSMSVFIQGTTCLFQTQAKYLHPCRQDATMPHGHSLQRGAPTVGALGDAVMHENGHAMDVHF